MSFGDDLQRFTAKVDTRSRAVFNGVVAAAHESITKGSPITGAPGQPVGQSGPGYHEGEIGGALLASWNVLFEAPFVASIVTNSPYAKQNEDGIARPGGGEYRHLSTIGGRHSVALTVAGVPHLLADEVAKVNP